jgi:hypothetical protein
MKGMLKTLDLKEPMENTDNEIDHGLIRGQ